MIGNSNKMTIWPLKPPKDHNYVNVNANLIFLVFIGLPRFLGTRNILIS